MPSRYLPSSRVLCACGAVLLTVSAWAQSSDQLPAAPSAVLQQRQQQQKPPAPAAKPADPPADSKSAPAPASTQKTEPAPAASQEQKAESLAAPVNPPAASKTAPASANDPAAQSAIPENATAETMRIRVNEVNLIFTVTDKHGKFIKNLTKSDIHVLDDHKAVDSIRDLKSETDLPLRVGLLIDASNSIRDRFKFEQEAAIEFLNQIVRPKTDLAFVVGFDTTADLTQDFTNDNEKLSHGVRLLRPGGGTALYDAVYWSCRDKLMKTTSPSGQRRAIILVSDGEDNQSRVSRDEAVEMAQRAEVIIYSISTNTSGMILHGDKVLQYIAESTGGRAFFPFKIEDVANAFSEIQEELRSQYALAYKPPDFRADGHYRTIEIEAQNNKKLRVRTRKGYYAPTQ
ncbi:MAG TPA: VWA domain-containing protein [Terriglobales bacterium]|nr:VWA domain-containing protein [Terriglobales bacterium]